MSAQSKAFEAATTHTARNLLIVAPPGCGKTELLARRAQVLIPLLAPQQRILALTFSNRAKANLDSRLEKVLGRDRKRQHVAVHNFHGHAAEIVRAHGRTLGVDPRFEMPNKHTQNSVIKPYLDGLAENEVYAVRDRIEQELREAKQRACDDAQVLASLSGSDERTLLAEKARQETGAMFYDDLLRHAQRLLQVPEIAHLYQAHYAAILVDEFQDLSPQQLDIALRTCNRSRTFVGDPLQGIYSWTGARPVQVGRILRRISGAPHGLGVSYRSSPRVLNLLGIVSSQLGGQTLEAHDPGSWFEGGITAGASFKSGIAEAEFIRDTCAAILTRQPEARIGVICRNGWRRKPVDAEFASSDLPCTRWDLAVNDAGIINLINAAVARLGGSPSLDALKMDLLTSVGATDVDTAADIVDAIEQLGELADHAGSVTAALGQLRVLGDLEEPIAAGIHLLNAHTGKGQQFDWVFIPGFEKGNMPSFLARERTQQEEEHRVLLVMISRARHGVVLTRAESVTSTKGKRYSPDPSPWVTSLRPGLVTDAAGLRAHIERFPRSSI